MKTKTHLRRADREDLDAVIRWMQDPDFVRFLYGDPARSPKQIREQLAGLMGRNAANALPAQIHLVIDHADHGPVGMVALQKISWRNRSCNIDVYVGRKELRTSVEGAAATYRAFEYCFDELNLHRVQAHIYAFNRPSWRLIERVGAKRELTLREHVLRDGVYEDMYSYGLLKREFDAFREGENLFKPMALEAMIENLRIEGLSGG